MSNIHTYGILIPYSPQNVYHIPENRDRTLPLGQAPTSILRSREWLSVRRPVRDDFFGDLPGCHS